MNFKSLLFKILYILRVHRILKLINRKKLTILMYHGFSDKKHTGVENYLGLHIEKQIFKNQLQYLKENYNIIFLAEAIKTIKEKKELPRHAVVITIDDGYKSNYTLAYPIIKELKLPATIFLTTAFTDEYEYLWVDRLEFVINNTVEAKLDIEIDFHEYYYDLNNGKLKLHCLQELKMILKSKGVKLREKIIAEVEAKLNVKLAPENAPEIYEPLSWADIKVMSNSGLIEFGSHTHTHAILSKGDDSQIREELLISKKMIEDNTRKKCRFFAYPNGQLEDFNQTVINNLVELKYECGLTTISGKNSINSDLYKLKRFYTSSRNDIIEFIMILTGVSSLLNNFRKIIKK